MDLDEYQGRAASTDRTGANYDNAPQKDVVVALLGIAGELGTLATTYKKFLRDGKSYELRTKHLEEELGDLLWYVATLASKFNLSLKRIARTNLDKIDDKWVDAVTTARHRDSAAPEAEQFPRKFSIEFEEAKVADRLKASMSFNGVPLGDSLDDNVEVPDGYRFHDAFHLSFVALLGWSPVLRKLMGRKRKSNSSIDQNEDGGRAIVIEEALAALIFEYGEDNGEMRDSAGVDYEFINVLRMIARRLEVSDVKASEWAHVVKESWRIFRGLTEMRGGIVDVDLDSRSISLRQVPDHTT